MKNRYVTLSFLAVMCFSGILYATTSVNLSTTPVTGSVTSAKIIDATILDTMIQNGAITTTKFGSGAVTATHIPDGIITATQIADASITSDKIAAGAATVPTTTQTVDFTPSMNATDIQALIDAVPKNIQTGAVITFQFADGNYALTSALTFAGFYGGGTIKIQGNVAESNATALHTTQAVRLDFSSADINGIVLNNNDIVFYIQNLYVKIKTDTTETRAVAMTDNSRSIWVQYNYLLGTSVSTGSMIYATYTNVYALKNYVSNASRGIYSHILAHISSDGNYDTGTVPTTGQRSDGGIIAKSNAQPNGQTTQQEEIYGGKIF